MRAQMASRAILMLEKVPRMWILLGVGGEGGGSRRRRGEGGFEGEAGEERSKGVRQDGDA